MVVGNGMNKDSKGAERSVEIIARSKNGGDLGAEIAELIGKKGGDFQQSVLTAFFRIEREFDKENQTLRDELNRERQRRKEVETAYEERHRIAVRDRRETQRLIKLTRRLAVGMSTCSMLLVLGLGADRMFQKGGEKTSGDMVEQLRARIDSYDTLMQSRETQLERYMFSENDKFGALLKAVDALKQQVAEMQWYVNDDTRGIMSDLRKHLDRLSLTKEEEK